MGGVDQVDRGGPVTGGCLQQANRFRTARQMHFRDHLEMVAIGDGLRIGWNDQPTVVPQDTQSGRQTTRHIRQAAGLDQRSGFTGTE